MSKPRKRADWPIIVGIVAPLLVAIALGLYVWGYYATSSIIEYGIGPGPDYLRIFNRRWQEQIYSPAARVESVICNCKVDTTFSPPNDP